MPLGASRLSFLAKAAVAAAAEVVQRTPRSISAINQAQIDTAQYKFGGSSLYVDGVDDYLSIPNSGSGGDFAFGSNDFTVEAWVRPTSVSGVRTYVAIWSNDWNNDDRIWYFGQNGANVVFYYYSGDNNTVKTVVATTTAPLAINTWYHVAVTGDSSNFKIYVNGSLLETETRETIDPLGGSGALTIGCTSGNAFDYQGHIDEVRISNNVRYTTGFTPSTTPFVNDSNTTLLVHADGTDGSTTFIDDNGARAPVGIQAIGNAQVDTAQSKFGGASAGFDGTDDFIDTNFRSSILTSTETIEFWYRPTTTSGAYGIMSQNTEGEGNGFQILYINGGIYVYKRALGSGDGLTGTGSITANTWHHIAVVNNSGTASLYIDGTLKQSKTGWTGTDDDTNLRFGEGKGLASSLWNATRYDMNGHLDEIRISNNARYTSGFTPSTTPFVNDANTLLLLHMDGTDGSTDFFDDNGNRAPNGIQAIGNAQISTAQKQFGTSSIVFDGSGDYLKLWDPQITNWGTGDFTIEFWLKTSDSGVNLIRANNAGFDQGFTINNFGTQLRFYSYYTGTTVAFSPESIDYTDNTWHHCAIVRNSGSVTFYIDGTAGTAASHTTSYSAILYDGAYCKVGEELDGYIDELRISDNARYTSSFTAPTTPFTSDANTLVLLHADGTNGSTTIFDDNG
jgi:hypothetical protein